MAVSTVSAPVTSRERPAALGWGLGIVLFGVPGVVLLITTAWINPLLCEAGVPLIWSFSAAMYGPLFVLLGLSVVAYRREGHPLTWAAVVDRMRLQPRIRQDVYWVLGAVVLAMAGEAVLEPTARWLAEVPGFTPPDHLPSLLDPFQTMVVPPQEFMGATLKGNWWVAGVYAVCLFGNIAGEELWWRGYILPRQEQRFGRWAWLVNALLWVLLFHLAMRWLYITLIPTGLLTPLLAQRTKSTWASIMIHGLGNVLFLGLIVAGIVA